VHTGSLLPGMGLFLNLHRAFFKTDFLVYDLKTQNFLHFQTVIFLKMIHFCQIAKPNELLISLEHRVLHLYVITQKQIRSNFTSVRV
jgi:hypothetical protein